MSPTGSEPPADALTAGFTLLELLVVLTLMALLTVAVPIAASHFANSVRLRASAQELAADLRALHGLALTSGQETQLDFDLPHNRYSMTSAPQFKQIPRDVKLVVTTTVNSGAQISPEAAVLRLFPDGTSNGARIELSERSRHYVIELNWLTSRVRIDE